VIEETIPVYLIIAMLIIAAVENAQGSPIPELVDDGGFRTTELKAKALKQASDSRIQ